MRGILRRRRELSCARKGRSYKAPRARTDLCSRSKQGGSRAQFLKKARKEHMPLYVSYKGTTARDSQCSWQGLSRTAQFTKKNQGAELYIKTQYPKRATQFKPVLKPALLVHTGLILYGHLGPCRQRKLRSSRARQSERTRCSSR